jgi:hypothetical protein
LISILRELEAQQKSVPKSPPLTIIFVPRYLSYVFGVFKVPLSLFQQLKHKQFDTFGQLQTCELLRILERTTTSLTIIPSLILQGTPDLQVGNMHTS